eukprot:8386210-Pyramimonas_sp.AAC.1
MAQEAPKNVPTWPKRLSKWQKKTLRTMAQDDTKTAQEGLRSDPRLPSNAIRRLKTRPRRHTRNCRY